jgi:hypothetical protein
MDISKVPIVSHSEFKNGNKRKDIIKSWRIV